MKKERCLPTSHLCDGEKQALSPCVPPPHKYPSCSSCRLSYSNTEAAALGSNTFEQVTCHLHPSPETKTLAENAVEHFQQSSKLEKIVINVDKMSLQEEKRARYTSGHSKIVFAGSHC